MKIAAYAPVFDISGSSSFKGFVVETFFSSINQHVEHTYIIITEKELPSSFESSVEFIIKPPPNNVLLKKIWRDVTLPATLKKLKAELFISFDETCLLTTSIPQIIVVSDPGKTKSFDLKKARLLIVNSETVKKQLIDHHGLSGKNISVIYPSAGKNYKAISTEEKAKIRAAFSEDKEYFFYTGAIFKNEDLVGLLKSFSHFKKRQQSGFKLLLLTNSHSFFEKTLSDYKYRADVKFITGIDENDKANITAAAYAVILPFNAIEDQLTALNSMQAGVPVIASKSSVVSEMAEEAALYAETGEIKEFGQRMMQVYTDENYRSQLIKKGADVANKFNQEKATEHLWQAIVKALE